MCRDPSVFHWVWSLGIEFAQLIGSENSIFAIEVPWPSAWRVAAVHNRTSILPTMEQLVAPYVSALSAHALSPCVLVGMSFQGLMAFEIAHQFGRRGGKVETVMLLDAKAKYPAPRRVAWETLKKGRRLVSASDATDGTAQSIASSHTVSLLSLCCHSQSRSRRSTNADCVHPLRCDSRAAARHHRHGDRAARPWTFITR